MKNIRLEAGMHDYEVTFENPQNAYNFDAGGTEIRFYGCDMVNE